jgi:hypothetical protein
LYLSLYYTDRTRWKIHVSYLLLAEFLCIKEGFVFFNIFLNKKKLLLKKQASYESLQFSRLFRPSSHPRWIWQRQLSTKGSIGKANENSTKGDQMYVEMCSSTLNLLLQCKHLTKNYDFHAFHLYVFFLAAPNCLNFKETWTTTKSHECNHSCIYVHACTLETSALFRGDRKGGRCFFYKCFCLKIY